MRWRIAEARPGDIVLLAGKGHEKVQVTREGSHPFDDVEVAREALQAAGFECEAARRCRKSRMKLTALENRRVYFGHACGTTRVRPSDEVAQGYSIDSRTIGAGELFFAVKGERLDGHDYVERRSGEGRRRQRSSRKIELHRYPDKARLLAVDDTLVALQTLATAVRKLWGKPLVGVTGSAGKTTTKEAIAHVLAARFRVLKSEGNFNNHFGLPLMLLKLEPEHDVAVIEMGMSHAGEIRALAKIAQPEIGVVTNVAPVHLEFFDSLAGIARAKYELIESLPASGTAVLNADDEYVSQFGRDFKGKVVTYGTRADRRCARRECADSTARKARSSTWSLAGGREHARLCRWSENTTF